MYALFKSRNDTDVSQTYTTGTVAQQRALANNRTEAVTQHKLAEVMDNSPRVLQQRTLSDASHNSPWMLAQRHRMNALHGEPVMPHADGAKSDAVLPAQREEKTNNTGLPNQLKSGIESLSGMSMDHVKVHYNSDKPAQLQAHAYAQGSEIHLGEGQERHLPHEAWHVVQQAQGRVRPTLQLKGGAVNDDPSLEKEADVMGDWAAQLKGEYEARNLVAEERAAGDITERVAGIIQRVPAPYDIFDFISTNSAELGTVTGAELKRLLYWNDVGRFVPENGKSRLTIAKVNKARGLKTPIEQAAVNEITLPAWMKIRETFGITLPEFFGSGQLKFPKRPENIVFDGRAWISDNVYWRSPANVRYMIHGIIEWTENTHQNPPTPHVTLRNADTQAKIDLDITNKKAHKRVVGLEPTRTSYSRGLGGNRTPGDAMARDDAAFEHLTSEQVSDFLKRLCDAAQTAKGDRPLA